MSKTRSSAAPSALSPLPVANWPVDLQDVAKDMNGKPLHVHELMAHSPDLLQAWWTFRNYSVNGGTLGPVLGEFVILRVGVHLQAWYEWGSHVDRAVREGIPIDKINLVLEPKITEAFTTEEALILRAVDSLMIERRLNNGLRAEMERVFTTAQMIDLMAIQGMYVILGEMIRTWGLQLDDSVADRLQGLTNQAEFEAKAAAFADALDKF